MQPRPGRKPVFVRISALVHLSPEASRGDVLRRFDGCINGTYASVVATVSIITVLEEWQQYCCSPVCQHDIHPHTQKTQQGGLLPKSDWMENDFWPLSVS